MTFKEMCNNLSQVDKHIWQDSGYFYYVSFWYYWYGVQCQCVRRFCRYIEAKTFRDKLLKILDTKEQK